MGKLSGIANQADLMKQFKTWADDKAREHVDQAIKDAVAVQTDKVLMTAQALVPVKSGKLKEALKKRFTNGGTVGKVYVDSKEAFYGFMVNFGTSKQPAQPFLYQAADQHRQDLATLIQANIRNEAKKD